jgi:O-antigen/teichoic acid export membrane protein
MAMTAEVPIAPSPASSGVRNAGWLVALRVLHLASGVAFAAIIPRMMGREDYGRYALLTSIADWFVMAAGLGFVQVFVQRAPRLIAAGQSGVLRRLFGRLFAMRVYASAVLALVYFVFVRLWLADIPQAAVIALGLAVFVDAVTGVLFAIFVGLGQAAKWGVQEVANRWLAIGLLVLGYRLGGLTGATMALVLVLSITAGLGLILARDFVRPREIHPHWRSSFAHLRFGAAFFVGTLLLSISQRSGEALVRTATGDYEQVALFGVAYSLYLMFESSLGAVSLAFAAPIAALAARGDRLAEAMWMDRLLRMFAVTAMVFMLGGLMVGPDAVRLVAGPSYVESGRVLMPLLAAGVLQVPAVLARLVSIVHGRPKDVALAAGVRLAGLWAFGLVLAAVWGGVGAAAAVLVGSLFYAVTGSWRAHTALDYSQRGWLRAILPGLPFVLLVVLRYDLWRNLGLATIACAGYLVLIFVTRQVSLGELRSIVRAVRADEGA